MNANSQVAPHSAPTRRSFRVEGGLFLAATSSSCVTSVANQQIQVGQFEGSTWNPQSAHAVKKACLLFSSLWVGLKWFRT
jgi:hypothetical protein